jgi:hypothetical protein
LVWLLEPKAKPKGWIQKAVFFLKAHFLSAKLKALLDLF